MILRSFFVSVAFFGLAPDISYADNSQTAATYIAASDYVSYRQQLVGDALNDPVIKKRIKNARSIEEINEILRAEIEVKLRKYRNEHGLDENGESKE